MVRLSFLAYSALSLDSIAAQHVHHLRDATPNAALVQRCRILSQQIVGSMLKSFDPATGVKADTSGAAGPTWWWWTYGVMWDSVLNYRRRSGDKQFDVRIADALYAQSWDASARNFFNLAQANEQCLALDDVEWWANAALTAHFDSLPDPSRPDTSGRTGSWFQLAENAYDKIMTANQSRPLTVCNSVSTGGLYWKLYPGRGYNYVSSITVGNLILMTARLFKGSTDSRAQEYHQKANDLWKFSAATKLVNAGGTVQDGFEADQTCYATGNEYWGYNHAIFMLSASVMYSAVTDAQEKAIWQARAAALMKQALTPNDAQSAPQGYTFGDTNILYNFGCEALGGSSCGHDQSVHKAVMANALIRSGMFLGWPGDTKTRINAIFSATAQAITGQNLCGGSSTDTVCKWPFASIQGGLKPIQSNPSDNPSDFMNGSPIQDYTGPDISALEVLQGFVYLQNALRA